MNVQDPVTMPQNQTIENSIKKRSVTNAWTALFVLQWILE